MSNVGSKRGLKLFLLWLVIFLMICVSFLMKSYQVFSSVFFGALILFGYVASISMVSNYLVLEEREIWTIPISYVMFLIVIGILFSLVIYSLGVMDGVGGFDVFYFSVITLTSVGYGDVTPESYSGKILSIAMSLIGTVHMIMYIAILLRRLK